MLMLRGNVLTGPTFPPAWLEPRMLPDLQVLELSDVPGLTGTLPASLPWPNLIEL